MRTFLSVIVMWFVSSAALAADPQLPVLLIGSGGYRWVIEDENGIPTIYEFASVVVVGVGGPKPPIVVPPTTGFGLESQARQWLLTVPESARANRIEIAKVMTDVASMAKDKKFNTLGEMEAVFGALLGNAITDKASWRAFGASLQTAITTLKSPASGKITAPTDLAQALTEVAKGMMQ